jgi:16S rRNA (cytosine967-C5)-methyltransferase
VSLHPNLLDARRRSRVAKLDTPADSALTAFFRANPAMGQRDRAFISEGAFAYLRRKRSEAVADSTLPRRSHSPSPRASSGFAAELEGALATGSRVARLQGAARALPDAVAADVPDWLWRRWAAYDDVTRRAHARLAAPAPFDLRAAVKATLTRGGWLRPHRRRRHAGSPLGLRVTGRPSLAGHPWLADGRLEVQDEGSQLIGYLVAPRRNDMAVDFCRRRRQDAAARRADALAVASTRSTCPRGASPTSRRGSRARAVRHPQAIAHERDTSETTRRQDRPRAGRRAMHASARCGAIRTKWRQRPPTRC